MALTPKEEYAKMVCLFLAEGLRTRRIDLQKTAEIAGKILQNINLLDTEHDFLSLIKELSKDFDELTALEQRVGQSIILNQKRKMEQQVREYAIQILVSDTKTALQLLQDAAQENITMENLYIKYPEFMKFLQKS
jgi:hypothetical protein